MNLITLSGMTVEVMLKDPVCWPVGRPEDVQLIEGPGATEWAALEQHDPAVCIDAAGESVCIECIDGWAIDHWVRVGVPSKRTRLGYNDVPGLEPL